MCILQIQAIESEQNEKLCLFFIPYSQYPILYKILFCILVLSLFTRSLLASFSLFSTESHVVADIHPNPNVWVKLIYGDQISVSKSVVIFNPILLSKWISRDITLIYTYTNYEPEGWHFTNILSPTTSPFPFEIRCFKVEICQLSCQELILPWQFPFLIIRNNKWILHIFICPLIFFLEFYVFHF